MIKIKQAARLVVLTGISAVLVFSCKDEKDGDKPDFDRAALLENVGNNIILPAYAGMHTSMTATKDAVIAFVNDPVPAKLQAARQSFRASYEKWQSCSPLEIGPAMDKALRAHANTYPTDTQQITANAVSGSYDLEIASNLDAQGFPAIDFLLNGKYPGESDALDKFTGARALAFKNYLSALSNDLFTRIQEVKNTWTSDYIGQFMQKSGTSVGSSLGDMVNNLNFDLELIKNYKTGVPVGAKTLGTPQPNKTEAFYGGYSVSLAILNLQAIRDLYLGNSVAQPQGMGLDNYLDHVDAKYNNGPLSAAITSQFAVALGKLQVINDPLSESVINDKAAVESAYNELKKLSVLLKTDMPSALGVLITYQDNDGD